MTYLQRTIDRANPAHLNAIDGIRQQVGELAKTVGNNIEFRAINEAFKEILNQYQKRFIATDAAQAIKELYEELPWLNAVSFSFSHEHRSNDDGDYYKSGSFTVDSMDPELPDFGIEDFQDALRDPSYVLNGEAGNPAFALTDKAIFTGYPNEVYRLLDPLDDDSGEPLTFSTSREMVQAADGNIDALAESLFPESWAILAQDLGLPYTPPAPKVERERP